MGKIVRKRKEFSGSSNSAENIMYDATKNVKEAIDEAKNEVSELNSNLTLVLTYNEDTDYFGITYNGEWHDILLAGLKAFWRIPTMTGNTSPSGAASASSNYNGTQPYQSMDDNSNTYWAPSTGAGDWVRYIFDTAFIPKKFKVMGTHNTSTWVFQGSNDNTNWTTLKSFTLTTSYTEYDITTTSAYKCYRLSCTVYNGEGGFGIREWNVFG